MHGSGRRKKCASHADMMKQHDLRKTEHPELCRIRWYQDVCKKIIRLEDT